MAFDLSTRSGRIPGLLKGAALALGLATLASSAGAELFFDIRLSDGSKQATSHFVGQVFDYEVFVQVTGADANTANDTFRAAHAYIRSAGTLHGDLTHENVEAFSFNNHSDGAIGDRDGDGDLDVGGEGTLNTTLGQIRYSAEDFTPAPTPVKIGGGTFTIKSLAGQTAVTFAISTPFGLNRTPSFIIDGVARSGDNASLISVGAPILVSHADFPPLSFTLEAAPDTPTFNLNVLRGESGHYLTSNPLSAGDELPAAGISSAGVIINGIDPGASTVFVLLGLNHEDALDRQPLVGGGTLVPENDPHYLSLKLYHPWLDALIRFNGDDDRAFNFDVSTLPGVMITEIAAVPEPAMLAVAALLPLALLRRRRHTREL